VYFRVCPLIILEREGRFPPNFQGSSRASRGWLWAQNLGVMGRGTAEWLGKNNTANSRLYTIYITIIIQCVNRGEGGLRYCLGESRQCYIMLYGDGVVQSGHIGVIYFMDNP